jgi:subtilisin family serine protease
MPGAPSDMPSDDDGLIADEVLLTAPDMAAAEQQRESLQALGVRILRRTALSGLGYVLTVYRVPVAADQDGLIDRLRRAAPGAEPEYNRRYRLYADGVAREYAADMVGFAHRGGGAGEGADLRLAMLDAPVDTTHPALAGARIDHVDVTGLAASSDRAIDHGTSVASLLVGSGSVQGALPGAHLMAVTIFGHVAETGWHTRTDWWLRGLDAVARAVPRPDAVNMSFGGAPSAMVEGALRMLHGRGLRFAAAAGNDGAASMVAFPANLPEVLAVTAVDVRGRAYANAPTSDLVALAAPGIDVWAAARGGGVYATGTSFAAPWVTACLAVARRAGLDSRDLLELAQDLGVPGKDPIYGAGLVRRP